MTSSRPLIVVLSSAALLLAVAACSPVSAEAPEASRMAAPTAGPLLPLLPPAAEDDASRTTDDETSTWNHVTPNEGDGGCSLDDLPHVSTDDGRTIVIQLDAEDLDSSPAPEECGESEATPQGGVRHFILPEG